MVVSLDLGATDLASRRTLEDIISLGVAKSKRILVVTGAGISCSCGIPDFRSSDGLYNLVKKQYPNVVLKGRDLFDASLFRDPESTSVFYTFISQLKQSIDIATPSPTHHFIKMLDTKKKLLRSYTQNIDGLEARAGLAGSSSEEVRATGKGKGKLRAKDVRNVQLHGDIHRVRCTFCSADLPCTPEYLKLFDAGLAPDCPECAQRSEVRVARSARPIRIGTLRPAIVLYDEAHPLGDDIGTIQSADIARKPDMLIVMGTSLKVHGLRRLVKEFAKSVHGDAPSTSTVTEGATGPGTGMSKPRPQWARKVIFVNKTPPGSEWNGIIDYHVSAETDAWAAKVLEYWRSARPADWEIQRTLDDSPEFRHAKAAVGGGAGKGKGAKSSKSLKFSAPRASGVADDVSAATAAARTRPTASGMENVPPSAAENASAQGVKPPSLVAKRPRSSMSHYTAGECSPSKQARRANGDMPPPPSEASRLAPEERGMLFGDTTNRGIGAGETATDAEDDGIPLAVVVKHKRRTKSVDARGRAAKVVKVSRTPRPKQQVEVVMRRNRGRSTVRDAEADVVDVFS